MAAPWAAGAQVRIVGELHGQQTVNVLHFATNTVVSDGPPLDQLLRDLCTAVSECITDTLLAAVTVDWRFIQVDAKRIAPNLSDQVIVLAAGSPVGQLAATEVSFAASLLNLRSGAGGKSGRGRVFLPPAGEAQIAQSVIDAPTMALLAAFCLCMAGKFIGDTGTEPWRLGILSRKQLHAAGGTFDNAFHPGTQLLPKADVAVMRSRRKGHGA